MHPAEKTRISCPLCESEFTVPEHLLGKRLRCPMCREMFQSTSRTEIQLANTPPKNEPVKAPDEPKKAEVPPPLPRDADASAAFQTANSPQWYYQIGDERYGPVTMVALRELARHGGIHPIDLLWKSGMPTALPASRVDGVFPSALPSRSMQSDSPSGITIPLLISAVSNILFGFAWLYTCVGVVIAIPMFILSAKEFQLYGRIGTRPIQENAASIDNLANWQIALGIFLNIPTLICGIVLKANAGKIR